MRFITGILAAAGLALAAAPASADLGISHDSYVGPNWDRALHTAVLAQPVAQPRLAVASDAYVGANWEQTPQAGELSTPQATATPDPRPSRSACTCMAHK